MNCLLKQLVHKSRVGGQTLYEKDRFYASYRGKIISLATLAKHIGVATATVGAMLKGVQKND